MEGLSCFHYKKCVSNLPTSDTTTDPSAACPASPGSPLQSTNPETADSGPNELRMVPIKLLVSERTSIPARAQTVISPPREIETCDAPETALMTYILSKKVAVSIEWEHLCK